MNPMTARGLGLGVAVAAWTLISHLANLPVQLWPVLVGLGCFLAAGGGISGLIKSSLGTLSGAVWVVLYVAISRLLGRNEILDALLLGGAALGMVVQARFLPMLSYTGGAIAGAGVALGVMGSRVTWQGALQVAIALAIGAGLGWVSEWI